MELKLGGIDREIKGKVSSFWSEFRNFAFRGNMVDLAVAVVIGTAFGAVVNSLVKNIMMPIISYLMPGGGSYREWHFGKVEIGAFLSELLNFLVVSLGTFLLIVKVLQLMQRLLSGESAPTKKDCPYCLSNIPLAAVRCPQCT
jgi:large conductance mechanosensitive channel